MLSFHYNLRYAPYDTAERYIIILEHLAAKAIKLNLRATKFNMDEIGLEFAELLPFLPGSRIPEQFIFQTAKYERDTFRSYESITIDMDVSYDRWVENPNKERLQLIYEDLTSLDISIKAALNTKYSSYERN